MNQYKNAHACRSDKVAERGAQSHPRPVGQPALGNVATIEGVVHIPPEFRVRCTRQGIFEDSPDQTDDAGWGICRRARAVFKARALGDATEKV